MQLIQAFAAEEAEEERVFALASAIMKANVQAVILRSKYFPFIRAVSSLNNAVIVGLGLYFYLQGEVTLGNILSPYSPTIFFLTPQCSHGLACCSKCPT